MDIVEKLRDIDAVGRIEDCGHSARDCAEAADEIERLRATLAMVADIAHSGGLVNHSEFTAMNAIRRLTLAAWNPHGTAEDHRERVEEAGREAVRRSSA